MNVQTQSQVEPIDHKTSRSICDAVGERLQEQFRPDDGNLSNRLRQLLEELRRRDRLSADRRRAEAALFDPQTGCVRRRLR